MKYSENWLREWVNPNIKLEALADMLTMAGIEVEEILPAAKDFTGVLVGQVIELAPHLNDPQLKVAQVDVGIQKLLQIVCGANNITKGVKVAVALENAQLPNGNNITATTIKDVHSEGMLCSFTELGLAEKSEGIIILADDAPIGNNIRDYFQLADYLLDLSITPNRSDCLSIRGLAREISALTQTNLTPIAITATEASLTDTLAVNLQADQACPHYIGRIIRNVNVQTPTPMWMVERLRRCGTRSINIVVDIMNYVMYELGQPMHAFDLNTLHNEINVRFAKAGESLTILDGTNKILLPEILIIADQDKPLAIAGVMGGLDSSVNMQTTNVFLESAYFNPQTIAQAREIYTLTSESAYRYERGVDPTLQQEAIERATQLILEIAGGNAGPIVEAIAQDKIPLKSTIQFSSNDISQVLGINIANEVVSAILNRLAFTTVNYNLDNWEVIPPPYRFDISLAEDVIEEIARLYGYENIPTNPIIAELNPTIIKPERSTHIRQLLAHLGYHEIITYSFISEKGANLFAPDQQYYYLNNPMSAEMALLRPTLLAGLCQSALYNVNRQQSRLRLFELGTCFKIEADNLSEYQMLSGLITGEVEPEQWGIPTRPVDFYDIKGDLESLLSELKLTDSIQFKPYFHPAFHPGQTAAIFFHEQAVGIIGTLHPAMLANFDFKSEVVVFEVNLSLLPEGLQPFYQEVSKFPEIRRDIAILINQAIPAKEIQDTIKKVAGNWLKDVFIFDVYQGKGIGVGQKSIALALIWQDVAHTLVDAEVTDLMQRVVDTLKGQLGAELRS